MGAPIFDPNNRNFWSDENMNNENPGLRVDNDGNQYMDQIAKPASYSDWAKGPNEVLKRALKPRPAGDMTDLFYEELEEIREI